MPGLDADYKYSDGNVEVYGQKGVFFEPDKHFTKDVVNEINELLVPGWRTGEKTGVWEQITEAGIRAGVAWKAYVPPAQCGVHPDNRSKFGVDGCQSQNFGKGILEVGWSWRKCSDSAAVQCPPSPLEEYAE